MRKPGRLRYGAPMTFRDWIDAQRGQASRSRFLVELSAETGISFGALHYASRGARVSPENARKLETFTSGAVTASSLVMLPRRADVRTQRHADTT